jgi:hypothetical protein
MDSEPLQAGGMLQRGNAEGAYHSVKDISICMAFSGLKTYVRAEQPTSQDKFDASMAQRR